MSEKSKHSSAQKICMQVKSQIHLNIMILCDQKRLMKMLIYLLSVELSFVEAHHFFSIDSLMPVDTETFPRRCSIWQRIFVKRPTLLRFQRPHTDRLLHIISTTIQPGYQVLVVIPGYVTQIKLDDRTFHEYLLNSEQTLTMSSYNMLDLINVITYHYLKQLIARFKIAYLQPGVSV